MVGGKKPVKLGPTQQPLLEPVQSLLAVHGPGLPALLAERTLAFRAYSGDHKMQSARVVHGGEPEQAAAELPALPDRPRLIGSWRAGPYWPASDSGW